MQFDSRRKKFRFVPAEKVLQPLPLKSLVKFFLNILLLFIGSEILVSAVTTFSLKGANA